VRFAARLFQEDGWWLAEVPAFRGAVTQGRTLEEARKMALDLVVLHLEDCWESGHKVRPDRTLPKAEGWEWVELPLRTLTAMQIRHERRLRKLTMHQVADLIGVAPATYQKWEDPRRCNATLETLEKIARAFGSVLEVNFRKTA
jgi:predicted RNase H-like HicB family nuclease/DNA-binding XRE family transcriptional regulator